jgi:MoxR-like ATPase
MLLAAARARALIAQRDYVTDEDVMTVAGPVLVHRIVCRDNATASAVVEEAGRAALGMLHS